MNVFNSLGSNYDFSFVLKTLFAENRDEYNRELVGLLEKKYGGKAILLYKGREAIGLVLEIIKPYLKTPYSSSEERSDESRSLCQVVINGFTCYAVYKAVAEAGYEPEVLDLDPSVDGFDLNFSANQLLLALKNNPNIKVVIIQNTLGYPCDIEKIARICKENNIILIEDLAHCVGTQYKNGKEAGTVGDFIILSFSQDKIIDAVSGGALIIRNKKYHYFYSSSDQAKPESREVNSLYSSRQARTINTKQQLLDRLYAFFTFLIRKIYPLRLGKLVHFLLKTFNFLSNPMNENFYEKFSLPNWYCSLVIHAFENLKKNLDHRRKIANIYNSILNKKVLSKVIGENIELSSNLRFPIFVEQRNDLIDYLKKEGIYVSDIWYDNVDKSLPNCQAAAKKILNLPTHINVSEEDAKKIAKKINHG